MFTALADGGDRILLDWQVAPGYYLYRHRISVKTATPGFALGDIAMPDGKKKTDEFFGDVEVYYGILSATVPVTRPTGASSLEIAVSYQGCADAGLCYPPVTKTVPSTCRRPARRAAARRRRWSPSRTACRASSRAAACSRSWRASSDSACCSHSRPACCR